MSRIKEDTICVSLGVAIVNGGYRQGEREGWREGGAPLIPAI